jgi:hypothetical protein
MTTPTVVFRQSRQMRMIRAAGVSDLGAQEFGPCGPAEPIHLGAARFDVCLLCVPFFSKRHFALAGGQTCAITGAGPGIPWGGFRSFGHTPSRKDRATSHFPHV